MYERRGQTVESDMKAGARERLRSVAAVEETTADSHGTGHKEVTRDSTM